MSNHQASPVKMERLVLQALCAMMKESDLQAQIHAGAVARIHNADRFRWILNWYSESGDREAFKAGEVEDPNLFHFVVCRAPHPLIHRMRRYRLDAPFYLRPLRKPGKAQASLGLLHTRTLYL